MKNDQRKNRFQGALTKAGLGGGRWKMVSNQVAKVLEMAIAAGKP